MIAPAVNERSPSSVYIPKGAFYSHRGRATQRVTDDPPFGDRSGDPTHVHLRLESVHDAAATSHGRCLCRHVLAAAVATPAATRTPPLARFVQTATSERESNDRAAEAASA